MHLYNGLAQALMHVILQGAQGIWIRFTCTTPGRNGIRQRGKTMSLSKQSFDSKWIHKMVPLSFEA